MDINDLTRLIIGKSLRVHTCLGPGLLESAYHGCLVYELAKSGLVVASNVVLPVIYDDVRIDVGYRVDLIVNDLVIVELKSVECIHPVHKAQLNSYLKLSGRKVGLLINFNVVRLKDGIVRWVTNLDEPLRPSASSALN